MQPQPATVAELPPVSVADRQDLMQGMIALKLKALQETATQKGGKKGAKGGKGGAAKGGAAKGGAEKKKK
jgi:hypothetical protein